MTTKNVFRLSLLIYFFPYRLVQLSYPTTPSGFRALSAPWGMPPSDPTCLTLPADDKHGYCHCCSWCSFQDLESDMILCFLFHQLAAVGNSGNLLGKVWNCEDTVSDGTCVGVKISKTFLTFLNLHYHFGRLQMSRPNTGRGYGPPHPCCVGHCHLGMAATTLTCSANSFPGDWNYVTMMPITRDQPSCTLIQLMVGDQVTGWHSQFLLVKRHH